MSEEREDDHTFIERMMKRYKAMTIREMFERMEELEKAASAQREADAKIVDQFAGQCCNKDDERGMSACCALTIAAAIRQDGE